MTKHCTDCNVKLTKRTLQTVGMGVDDLCSYCYDAAATYNEHQDGLHVKKHYGKTDMCEGCGTYDPEAYWASMNVERRTSNRSAGDGQRTHMSHAACYTAKAHDKSPAGRAGCRKFRDAAQS
ncbi:hypothetical protein SEA_ORLA_41 [Gordonia phage Orla]|nr:hypothetical protein SEA_ORLA_41 [Gordonia phage Orla]